MPNTDPNSLLIKGINTPTSWFKSGEIIQGVGEDPEYDSPIMLSDVIDSPEMLERYRGQQQSGWQQFGRAVAKGVMSAPFTAVESASYLFDPGTWSSLFTGEQVEDNAIAEWAKANKAEIGADNRIYSETGAHDLSDPATRFELLSSVIDSGLAFAATGAATMGAAGYLGSALKATKFIQGYAKAMKAVDVSAKLLAGTAQNIAEGRMVAMEGYAEGKSKIDQQAEELRNNLYADKIKNIELPETELKTYKVGEKSVTVEVVKGTDDPITEWQKRAAASLRDDVELEVNSFVKDAKSKLAAELTSVQRWNTLNIASDVFALRGAMKGISQGISRVDRYKKVGSRIAENLTTKKGLARTALDMGLEGTEEVGQEIMKNEAISSALDSDTHKATSFFQRMGDYVQDNNVRQSFVAGMFGGPVQSGATTLMSSLGEIWNSKAIDEHNKNVDANNTAAREQNKRFLDSYMRETVDLTRQREEADAVGDEDASFELQNKMFGNLVYNNATNGTVGTLEENLNDLAYGEHNEQQAEELSKTYGANYRSQAKEWLKELPKYENEFVKAHHASRNEQGEIDQTKRATLFSLATRISTTERAVQNNQNKIDELASNNTQARELTQLEAQRDRINEIIEEAQVVPQDDVDPLTRLARSLDASVNILEGNATVPTNTQPEPVSITRAKSKLNEIERRIEDIKPNATVPTNTQPEPVSITRAKSKLNEIERRIDEIKPNVTTPLNAKDKDEVTQYARTQVDNQLLNEHYNNMYVDVKKGKTDFTEAQAKTMSAIVKSYVGHTQAVNGILQNTNPIPARPDIPVNTDRVQSIIANLESPEQIEQYRSAADRLVNATNSGMGYETMQEDSDLLDSLGVKNSMALISEAESRVEQEAKRKAREDEFERNVAGTKQRLFNALEDRNEVDEESVAEYEKLSENPNNAASLSELANELSTIYNHILAGEELPENVNREVALETVSRMMANINANVTNNTDIIYGEVNHYDDYLESTVEEATQNNEFGNDRKLKAVNAVAYNGTDVEDSMIDFVNYVNNPNNTLQGREVQYGLPTLEDMGEMTEDEARAVQMVHNKQVKSKADIAFIHKNLPVRITILGANGETTIDGKSISAWLHSTSYGGYSPAIQNAVDTFNRTTRTQIIDNLLAGKKIYTTIKGQRGGYGNRQFWYTKNGSRVIVNTQDPDAMREFNDAVNASGSKAKRTPVHNRIGDAVDTIELQVADNKGEIDNGTHNGKKPNNIYFKAITVNGSTRYVRAYVRSAKDSKTLLNDVLTNVEEAKTKHTSELQAVAKFLGKTLESLTSEDIVRTLFNNADAILVARGSNLDSIIDKARMRIDYSQLSNPDYLALITEGSNPILYTNMAKYSNNTTRPSLFVQGTIELEPAYHFNKGVPVTNITPVVDETVKQADIDNILNNISDPKLRKELQILLPRASKKDLQLLSKFLSGSPLSTTETLESLRAMNKLLVTKLPDKLLNSEAIVSLWNEFFLNEMDEDTIDRINEVYGKSLLKSFAKFKEVIYSTPMSVTDDISSLPSSNVENTIAVESNTPTFNTDERIQILGLLDSFVVGNSTFDEVINSYAKASEFSGNAPESTAILNELRTDGTLLNKEARVYVQSRLNANNVATHLSNITATGNSVQETDGVLREAFTKVTNRKGDNTESYTKDNVAESLEEANYTTLANLIRSLNEEEFADLRNHYTSSTEVIEDIVPETITDISVPANNLETAVLSPDRFIRANRDSISEQVGKGLQAVVYEASTQVEQQIVDTFNAITVNDFGDLMYKQYLIDYAYTQGYTELGDTLTTQSFGVLSNLVATQSIRSFEFINSLGIAHGVSENIQSVLRVFNNNGFYTDGIESLLPKTTKRYDSREKSKGNEIWYIRESNGVDINGNRTFAPIITNSKGEVLILLGTRTSKNELVGIYAKEDSESAAKADALVEQDSEIVFANSQEFIDSLMERIKQDDTISENKQSEASEHFADTVDVIVLDNVEVNGIRYKVEEANGKLYATAEGKTRQVAPPSVRKALSDKIIEDYKKYCK